MRRDQILFEQELGAVRQGLQQAKRTHAAGTPAVLHVSHHFPLQPHAVGNGREQNEKRDHGLDHRHEDESSKAQG